MEVKICNYNLHTKNDFVNKFIEIYTDLDPNEENKDKIFVNVSLVKNYINSEEMNNILNLNIFKYSYTNISKINFTANELNIIPETINALVNLKILILNNNKIQQISNINNLINLEKLELRSNLLTRIQNLDSLANLKYLTVSNNLINNIEHDDIPNLLNLTEFGMFGNFLGKENIKLDIEINKENKQLLKNICILLNKKLPNLKNIYIGGNHFTNLLEGDNEFINIVKENIKSIIKIDGN